MDVAELKLLVERVVSEGASERAVSAASTLWKSIARLSDFVNNIEDVVAGQDAPDEIVPVSLESIVGELRSLDAPSPLDAVLSSAATHGFSVTFTPIRFDD